MADDIGMHVSSRELERLAERLRAQGSGTAQERYQRAVADSARPLKAQLAAAARSVRVTSSRGGTARPDRSTGLRARVAAAVDSRPTRKGVRFFVDAERVDPEYGASLSRYLDGELQQWRRWRHPVFGHADRWVQQTGSPWFFRTIRRHANRLEQALEQAMAEVADDIEG